MQLPQKEPKPIQAIRERADTAGAAVFARPGQKQALGNIIRFFALLLVLTLVARGASGATRPTVTIAHPNDGHTNSTLSANGTLVSDPGTVFTLPEGLLVEQVAVKTGETVQAGDVIATFDAQEVEQTIALKQAELAKMQLQASQLRAGQAADPFATQQAQDALQRAYDAYHKMDDDGQKSVKDAQNARDSAQNALDALRRQPPPVPGSEGFAAMATPEQAAAETSYADWQAKVSAAEAAVQQADAALKNAQSAAEGNLDTARNAAQSAEDSRNSTAHSYEKEAADNAKANAASRADAAVLAAQIEQAKTALAELRALQDAQYACKAPLTGTVTSLELQAGSKSPAVGGLIADANAGYTLTFPLSKDFAKKLVTGDILNITQGTLSGQTTVTSFAAPDADGTVTATASLPAGGNWKAGGVTVSGTVRGTAQGVCVPLTALHSDLSGDFVYVIEEQNTVLGQQNVLLRTPVSVLERGDSTAVVAGGVSSSSDVVTGSSKPLTDGARVQVKNT